MKKPRAFGIRCINKPDGWYRIVANKPLSKGDLAFLRKIHLKEKAEFVALQYKDIKYR